MEFLTIVMFMLAGFALCALLADMPHSVTELRDRTEARFLTLLDEGDCFADLWGTVGGTRAAWAHEWANNETGKADLRSDYEWLRFRSMTIRHGWAMSRNLWLHRLTLRVFGERHNELDSYRVEA